MIQPKGIKPSCHNAHIHILTSMFPHALVAITALRWHGIERKSICTMDALVSWGKWSWNSQVIIFAYVGQESIACLYIEENERMCLNKELCLYKE